MPEATESHSARPKKMEGNKDIDPSGKSTKNIVYRDVLV
jgi:hypothetical protein